MIISDDVKSGPGPEFPDAPRGWKQADAAAKAAAFGLSPIEAHWETVRALQEFYARNDDSRIIARELHDALEERFHHDGGMKYLYKLFPGGPLAQGCKIAGLEPPAGSSDAGFGSVR